MSFALPLADILVAHGDAGNLVNFLIYVVVLCLIFGLVWWVVGLIPLPAPVKTVVTVILAVIAVLILIDLLLGVVGHPLIS